MPQQDRDASHATSRTAANLEWDFSAQRIGGSATFQGANARES